MSSGCTTRVWLRPAGDDDEGTVGQKFQPAEFRNQNVSAEKSLNQATAYDRAGIVLRSRYIQLQHGNTLRANCRSLTMICHHPLASTRSPFLNQTGLALKNHLNVSHCARVRCILKVWSRDLLLRPRASARQGGLAC